MSDNVSAPTCDSTAVRFEIEPNLPDGVYVLPVEREGEMVWLVREGHMSVQLREDLNRLLRHVVGSGLWVQNWGAREHPDPGPLN